MPKDPSQQPDRDFDRETCPECKCSGPAPSGASPPEKEDADIDSVASALAADLDQLRSELDEAKDRALRSAAELENYRKRANRQMEEERRYANVELIRELLPIWDNMGRVVEAARKASQDDALLEGFVMVRQQLEAVLERNHCVKIEALHQPFDPHLHEAISQMPSGDHPAGTVLHVTQTGFRVEDRIVRPSQVVVSTAADGGAPPAETSCQPAP